MSSFVVTIG